MLLSELAFPDAPACVPFGPAVTTSRKELPVTALLATRRPLPLMEAIALELTFSFVLEASDLESSGWGRALGGGILDVSGLNGWCWLPRYSQMGSKTLDDKVVKSCRRVVVASLRAHSLPKVGMTS